MFVCYSFKPPPPSEGLRPQEIASTLFISQHTVRNHLRAIYAKLEVHSQVELLRKKGYPFKQR